MTNAPLPIDDVLPELIEALGKHPSVVLEAPTGAGKTTRVPPALLDAGLAGHGRIIMLEPRRLAARAAARRISMERRTDLGFETGYQVRFENKCGKATRILVVTPGILLRLLHDDPYLEAVSILVFDEFHERGLETDLALGMARLMQQTVRPDLRLIVMSATLATERISLYLGGCPIIASAGKLFPVEISYEARPTEQSWPVAAAAAVRRSLRRTTGDVLVFLPGMQEIRHTARELEPLAAEYDLAVMPLHGDLPPEQQDAALLPQSCRKVVLSTNVAETSVTVEGVTAVVDTGLARQMLFDPAVGLDRLELTGISQASADQRAGRAGRTQPGICTRLWSQPSHGSRPAHTEPEIRRVDVSGALLQLLAFGEASPELFPWLDAPPQAAVTQGLALLRMLGALDEAGLTPLGARMAQLPVHPRLARLLIEGQQLGCPNEIALAAAMLSERDAFSRAAPTSLRAAIVTESDIVDRLEAIEEFERSGRFQFAIGELHRGGAHFVLRARDQLRRLLQDNAIPPAPLASSRPEAIMRSLLAAFPDRLARRRNPSGQRGVMVGGRGVKLMPSSRVHESELFLCIDVDAGTTEAIVRLASAVRRDWLDPERLKQSTLIEFNPQAEKIEARRLLCFEDLQLESTSIHLPSAETTAPVLAAAAMERLERVQPAADSPAGQFLLRTRWLRGQMPDLGLPAFEQNDFYEIVLSLCGACRTFDDLRKADWLGAVQSRLTYAQRQTIDREAPEQIEVPSGSRITLAYEANKPPVLAVRIQEMFGLADTPRLAGGRVRLILHLLAPNFRPQQVTDDLSSFWANTYPTVRKELRVRYPKHSWPEDPLAAEAVRGPRRKS